MKQTERASDYRGEHTDGLVALECARYERYKARDGVLAGAQKQQARRLLASGGLVAVLLVFVALQERAGNGGGSPTPMFDWWLRAREALFLGGGEGKGWRDHLNLSILRETARDLDRTESDYLLEWMQRSTRFVGWPAKKPKFGPASKDGGQSTFTCPEVTCVEYDHGHRVAPELEQAVDQLMTFSTKARACEHGESLAFAWATYVGIAPGHLDVYHSETLADCWVLRGNFGRFESLIKDTVCSDTDRAYYGYQAWVFAAVPRAVDAQGQVVDRALMSKASGLAGCLEDRARMDLGDSSLLDTNVRSDLLATVGVALWFGRSDARESMRYLERAVELGDASNPDFVGSHVLNLLEVCALLPCSPKRMQTLEAKIRGVLAAEEAQGITTALMAVWSMRTNDGAGAQRQLGNLIQHLENRSVHDWGSMWAPTLRFLREERAGQSEANAQIIELIGAIDGPYTPERRAKLVGVQQWVAARQPKGVK